MNRRNFLERTAIAVPASLFLESFWPEGCCLMCSALAAGNGDDQRTALEQKFAEFALSIRYEALPADVVASAKRVLLDQEGLDLAVVFRARPDDYDIGD